MMGYSKKPILPFFVKCGIHSLIKEVQYGK